MFWPWSLPGPSSLGPGSWSTWRCCWSEPTVGSLQTLQSFIKGWCIYHFVTFYFKFWTFILDFGLFRISNLGFKCYVGFYTYYVWICVLLFWNFGIRILDLEFWILDSGFSILYSVFWILNSEFWIWDLGFWILDSGFWILDSGFWILDSGFWILDNKSEGGRERLICIFYK